MTPELTVYMLPSRHCALSTSLYGEEHGSGERILSLDMVSGQDNLNIKLPVLCRYTQDSFPILSTEINKNEWTLLCNIVAGARNHVKVIFDDSSRDHLAKITIPGTEPPRDGGVKMSFCRIETDEAKLLLGKGLGWIKMKLSNDEE
jgi:hypothetical protein